MNKILWNSNQNTKLFIQENAHENIVCKMVAILSRGRWVNKIPPLSNQSYWLNEAFLVFVEQQTVC